MGEEFAKHRQMIRRRFLLRLYRTQHRMQCIHKSILVDEMSKIALPLRPAVEPRELADEFIEAPRIRAT